MNQLKWERTAIFVLFLICFVSLAGIMQRWVKAEASESVPDGNQTYVLQDEIPIDLPNLVNAISDPVRDRIYITNWYRDIVIINATTGSVETTIAGVIRPAGLALSPDGSRLYVSSDIQGFEDGHVTVIDTNTFQILHTHIYPGMGHPYYADMRSIAGGPDNRVYLAPYGAYDTHLVDVMDGDSGNIVATIPFTDTEYANVNRLAVSDTKLFITAEVRPDSAYKLFKYDISDEQPILEEEIFIDQNGFNELSAASDGSHLVGLSSGTLNIYQTNPLSPTESIAVSGNNFYDYGITGNSQSVLGLIDLEGYYGPGDVYTYDIVTAELERTFTDLPQAGQTGGARFVVPLQGDRMAIIYPDRVRIFTPADYSTHLPTIFNDYCPRPIQDDFSDPSSGWPVADNGSAILRYLNGEYNIFHRDGYRWTAVTRGDVWANSRMVEVETRMAANNGVLGIVFGLNNDWSNFYTFEITPQDQYYYLLHYTAAGGWGEILSGYDSSIHPGNAINKLTIERSTPHMNFYINGERIYSSLEEKPGRVGLTGGSFIWNTDLRYDNYVFVDEGCPLSGQLFESGVPEFAPPIPSPYQELKAPNR